MIKQYMVGNLVADPELVPGRSAPLTEFRIAARSGKKDKEGNMISHFFKVSAFSGLSEIAMRLRKGDEVVVAGDFSIFDYVSKENTNRYVLQVRADSIRRVGKRNQPTADQENQDELPI